MYQIGQWGLDSNQILASTRPFWQAENEHHFLSLFVHRCAPTDEAQGQSFSHAPCCICFGKLVGPLQTHRRLMALERRAAAKQGERKKGRAKNNSSARGLSCPLTFQETRQKVFMKGPAIWAMDLRCAGRTWAKVERYYCLFSPGRWEYSFLAGSKTLLLNMFSGSN